MNISYSGYLTEGILLNIFSTLFGKEDVISQYKEETYPFKKYKYDILVKSKKLIIEFDGELHYTDINTIKRDLIKNNIIELGYTLIRIPYFVQLTTDVFNYLFPGIDVVINQNYPHGFIDKKAKLPSNFCSHGELKFLQDLEKFSFIKEDIINSLKNSFEQKEFVLGIGHLKNLY